MKEAIAAEEAIAPRWGLLRSLENLKVCCKTGVKVTNIKENCVEYKEDGVTKTVAADTVVIAVGSKPNNSFAAELEKEGFDVRVIGDAKAVRLVLHATSEGYDTAKEL